MLKRLPWLCVLVIGIAATVTFQPALKIGYEGGWWYLDWVSKLPLPNYLLQFFDPRNVTQGYRPMQGMMILAEYALFRFSADGYHLAQIGMHSVTCGLLFAVVRRLGNLRIALVAALFYAGLPAYHLAIFRAPAVVDPFASIFYLATVWFWLNYLESRRRIALALTLGSFALALLSKEISVFLPFFLFLIDWWFLNKKLDLRLMAWRYFPFFTVMLPYLALEFNVQSHGEFSSQFGYKLGPQFLFNLLPYLATLTFPWYLDNFHVPADFILYVWLAFVGIALVVYTVVRRSKPIAFLILFTLLNISPLLGFPQEWFQARYLYVSFISIAMLAAMVLDAGWRWMQARRVYRVIAAGMVAFLVALNGQGVAVKAADWAEFTRVVRVPFRDIVREHPAFPDDTFVYFLYPTRTSLPDFKGLFLVQYGTKVTVSGTDDNLPPDFRDHKFGFIYYFDETERPHEIVVDQTAAPSAAPLPPFDFNAPVRLEGFDIAQTRIKRGQPLVLLLYWKALENIDQDYTVFVHLADGQGQQIAGYDSQPRRGEAPTSQWRLNQRVVDALLFPTNDVPSGDNYRLEIGLYHQRTMQRLSIIDQRGQTVTDKIVIEGIAIVE